MYVSDWSFFCIDVITVYASDCLGNVITPMTVGIIQTRRVVTINRVTLMNLSATMVIVFHSLIDVTTIRTVLTTRMNRDVV
jgi:hypothetical protein